MDSFFLRVLHFSPLLLCLVLSVSFAKPVTTAEKLTALKENINALESALKEKQAEESAAQITLRKIEKEIGDNEEKIRTIESKISSKEKALSDLKIKATALNATYEKEQDALAKQIEARFKTYKKEQLQLIFGQHDLTKATRVRYYYHYFNTARKKYMDSLKDATQAIRDNRAELKKEQASLESLKNEHLAKAESLAKSKSDRKALISTLNQAVSTQTHSLETLKKQEKELNALTRSIQNKISKLDLPAPNLPFAKLKGKLSMPIAGQYSLATLSNSLLKTRKHLYLSANEGTPVHAIYEGRIVFADWLKGLGFLIIIDHGNGFMSLYANNQILYKSPGDWVHTGEKISLVGQSGGQPKPGLYFEIRKDGEALDPKQWFAENAHQ